MMFILSPLRAICREDFIDVLSSAGKSKSPFTIFKITAFLSINSPPEVGEKNTAF